MKKLFLIVALISSASLYATEPTQVRTLTIGIPQEIDGAQEFSLNAQGEKIAQLLYIQDKIYINGIAPGTGGVLDQDSKRLSFNVVKPQPKVHNRNMPPLRVGELGPVEGDIQTFSWNTKAKQIAKLTTKHGKTYVKGIKVGTGGVLTRTTGGPNKPGSWNIENLNFKIDPAQKKK